MATNNAVNDASAPFTVSAGNLTVTSGNLLLPTTSSTVGQIQINSVPVFHTYGTDNTFIGASAGNLTLDTTWTYSNLAIGPNALKSLSGIGKENIGIGINAGTSISTAEVNICIGVQNGASISTGNFNTLMGGYCGDAITDGASNTAVGHSSLGCMVSGKYNTAMGYTAMWLPTAGSYSVAIGSNALRSALTGSNNIGIGTFDSTTGGGSSLTTTDHDNICIGNTGSAGDINTTRIGTQGTSAGQQDKCYIAGIYNTAVGATAGVVLSDSAHKLGGLAGAANTIFVGGTKPSFTATPQCTDLTLTGVLKLPLTKGDVLCATADNVVGVRGAGTNGQIMTAVTTDIPAWTTATYPATLAKGLLMVATAANVIGGLTGSTGTAGQLLVSGGAATEPTWTTNTYATTASAGTIIVATAANTIGELASTGTAGQILTSGGAATVPAWTTATYPATLTKGDVLCATADNVVGVRGAGTNGQIMTAVTTDIPAWTTATYPATIAKGEILHASAANVISALTAGTADYVLTAHGAGNAVTWEAAPGGGIGTLNGDSGSATGATVTIAGGTNITTAAASATLTVNLDAVLTGLTSATFSTGGSVQSGTTATNTLLIQAYDVDGTAYVPFITLTSADTPTCDLATGVTIGSAYIYRGSGTDVAVADGGTGLSTLTAHAVYVGNGASAPTALAVGATGEILLGNTTADPSWLAASTDGKVLTAHTGALPTWETPGAGATWMTKANLDANATATVNYAYTINHATPANLLEVTLPATAAVGDRVEIVGNTAGMWKLIVAAGDTIKLGSATTSAGGYLAATNQYDCIEVVCTVANTTWVTKSVLGNITYA